jgi:hypothetical protein
MQLITKNEATAAERRVYIHLVDATDGITAETGEGGGQPQLSTNGAAFGNTSATLTAIGNGAYYVELTQSEVNFTGFGLVRFKSANTAEAQVIFRTTGLDLDDTVRAGLTALPNAAAEAAGGLYTRGTGAGQINQPANGLIDVNVENWNTTAVPAEHTAGYPIVTIKDGTGTGEIDTTSGKVSIATGGILAASFAAGAIDAAAIANGAIDAATFAAGAIDAAAIANGAIDAATFAAGAIDAAAIATGAIDADALASDAVTEIRSLVSGTADSGSTTTMVDAARTEADTDYWKGCWILFTSGTVVNQVRLITAFDPGTDTITFAPATTQAISTNTYEILPAGAVDLRLWNGTAPSNLISGRVDANAQVVGDKTGYSVSTVSSGAITSGSFAAGAIDNAAFNVTETLTANPAAGGITAASFAAGAIDAAAIANGAIDAATFAAGAIDAAAIANGAIDAATFAAGAIDAAAIANGAIDAATFAAGAIDAAAIATGAIDADALSSDAITEIRSLVSGTADSGSTTTMVDAARTEADTDYWKGCWILFTSGSIVNQVRLITAFDPGTDTITFAPATTQAVSTNTYEILPAGRVDLHFWQGTLPNVLVSGRVDASVGALATGVITSSSFTAGAIDNAAFNVTETLTANPAAGGITSGSFAAGAITAAAIATDAIDADALAADAANEIRDAVWAKVMSELASVPGVTGTVLQALEWLFLLSRNKVTQTSTTQTLRNDADSATIGASTLSDDGTTFTRNEFA